MNVTDKLKEQVDFTTGPACPYCSGRTELTDSVEVYSRSYGPIWLCRPCTAFVGCHPGTTTPLGRPADKATRQARKQAHDLFDTLWRYKMRKEGCTKKEARGAGYAWLRNQLGITESECHMGQMDKQTAERVAALCKPYVDRIKKRSGGPGSRGRRR